VGAAADVPDVTSHAYGMNDNFFDDVDFLAPSFVHGDLDAHIPLVTSFPVVALLGVTDF
jgi:hypothetical protein